MRFATCLLFAFLFAVQSSFSTVHSTPILDTHFDDLGPGGELPPGWVKGPPASAPYFAVSRSDEVFGENPPAVRVDAPLTTLHYRLASPSVPLPSMNGTYTLTFRARVVMPDCPFEVDVIFQDTSGEWTGRNGLFALVGEEMSGMRTFRATFRPGMGEGPGRCWIGFGLPYARVLRQGTFWLDDVVLTEGGEPETLAFYLSPGSVRPGETVDVHVSSTNPRATVRIRHEGLFAREVWTSQLDGLSPQPVPEEVWRVGCGWPISERITIPADWPSGAYTVTVDNGHRSGWETLIVSGDADPRGLAVIIPTHTDQAYNRWGGRNFYGNPRSVELSFDRPTLHIYKGFYHTPVHLIRWLSREQIPFSVFSDHDLHERGDIIAEFPAIALTWHSEYWTQTMRDNIGRHSADGGSLICMSGNTCWFQTRLVPADDPFEPGESERLVCYKSASANDPYHDIDPTQVTSLFDELPIPRPPEWVHGLSWRYGGMVNWSSRSDIPGEFDWLDGHGGYTAVNSDHWIYANTDVQNGTQVGQALAIVGYEVDGAPLDFSGPTPRIAWNDPPADAWTLLGHAPCWNFYGPDPGVGCMAILDRADGSFTFNGGTTGWCWGLAGDPVVQRMTLNLVERALDVPMFTRPLAIRAFPSPAARNVQVEIASPSVPRAIGVFGHDGRHVANVSVRKVARDRGVANWDFRDAGGRAVSPGVYFLGSGALKSRVVHVK